MNVLKTLFFIFLLILIFLVIFPLASLLQASFTTTPPGVWTTKYSLDNWIGVLSRAFYYKIVLNTFLVGVGATFLCTVMGLSLAWIISKTNVPYASTLMQLVTVPFYIPPFVGAIAWVTLFGPEAGFINYVLKPIIGGPLLNIYSIPGLILVLGLYYTPILFLICFSAFRSVDATLEESAAMSGAGRLTTLLRITMPCILPAIAGGIILTFTLIIEDFGASAIIGMPSNIYVLSTYIYSLLSQTPPSYGTGTVSATILIAITVIGVYLYTRLTRYSKRYATIVGRIYRPKVTDLGRWKHLAFAFCICYVILSTFLPLLGLLLSSFLRYYTPTLEAFSFYNWEAVFSLPRVARGITNTLIVATLGATIGIFFSLFISYIVYRTDIPKRHILDYFSALPLGIPGIALASALLWVWVQVPGGLYGTIWLLMIAYITRFLPHATRTTSSTIIQIHPELEESAMMCGASRLRSIRSIVIPLAKYGLLSGWILLYIMFTREIACSILLYSTESIVLPVVIFNMWEAGSAGMMSALSIIQIVMIFLPLFIVYKLTRRFAYYGW